MDDFLGGKTLIYKSQSMYERRRRVLREARKMIAEVGCDGFSIRELCKRAAISHRTLYNAYGSKENVISLAIRQYLSDFHEKSIYAYPGDTLVGCLERIVHVHARNLHIRPYTTAIMNVYYSMNGSKEIYSAIRNIGEERLAAYTARLRREDSLADHTTESSLVQNWTALNYAILLDWCRGDISDDDLINREAEALLIIVAGMTKGAEKVEAENWLQDLRGDRPGWKALRELAERGDQADPGDGN